LVLDSSKMSEKTARFWGVAIKGDTSHIETLKFDMHVTQAALDTMDKKLTLGSDAPPAVLTCKTSSTSKAIILCSFRAGQMEHTNLNLKFQKQEIVEFKVLGRGTVHVSGYQSVDSKNEKSEKEIVVNDNDYLANHSESEHSSSENEAVDRAIEAELRKSQTKKRKEEITSNETPKKKAKKQAEKPKSPRDTATTEASLDTSPKSTPVSKKRGDVAPATPLGKEISRSQAPQILPLKSPLKRQLPTGLSIEDLVLGMGTPVKAGKVVSVRYIGKLSNGQVFDSAVNKPFKFRLGVGQVIKGWDTGLMGMRVGGKRSLVIPPALAYGPKGAPPTIPPNATLTFEVDLMEA